MTKYNARKTTVRGIKFDSKLEANRYLVLLSAQQQGRIAELSLQPKFTLQDGFRDARGKKHRAITYKADFAYKTPCGSIVIEDAKGVQTPVFKLKKKLLLHKYPEINFRLFKATSSIGLLEE